MQKVTKFFEHAINSILVISLSLMVILVFGNVVLRYVFSSGINWAEEISRFLFIWLTFLGAIIALKSREHLGVDFLVRKLPPSKKKFVLVINNTLMMLLCFLILQGSWKLTNINIYTKAPASGLPLSVIYAAGILTSVAMLFIFLRNLHRVLFLNDTDTDWKEGDPL